MRAFIHNYLSKSGLPVSIGALDELFANENSPKWYQGLADKPLVDLESVEVCQLREQAQDRIGKSQAGTILVKTHNYHGDFDGYPLHNLGITAGAIYIVRNPLDVTLSVADHFGLDVAGAIDLLNTERGATEVDEDNMGSILGSWSFHVQSWTQSESDAVKVVRYEDLLDKPIKAFGSVLSLLNQDKNAKQLKQAVRHSSFDTLRKQEDQQGFKEKSPNSKRFFRKGKSNQWRTKLSRDQVAEIVDQNREQMQRFKYIPKGY